MIQNRQTYANLHINHTATLTGDKRKARADGETEEDNARKNHVSVPKRQRSEEASESKLRVLSDRFYTISVTRSGSKSIRCEAWNGAR